MQIPKTFRRCRILSPMALWSDLKMVLKNDSENEKIRKAKKRMERLKKKYNELSEKLRYLRDRLKHCEELTHRSECHCCRQKIDPKFYEKQIPELKFKIEIIYAWISQNYDRFKLARIQKPILEKKNEERKKWETKINNYLKANRNLLNKAIRTFELPKITDIEEKKLWNEAIQLQLDNRGMDEDEDLEFEIEN